MIMRSVQGSCGYGYPSMYSRSLWKTQNPQICMNEGFYGQHSFRTAPFNLIRVQFGISRVSDILFLGFHQERRKGIQFVFRNLTTTLSSIFLLSLFISQGSRNQDGCVYITLKLPTREVNLCLSQVYPRKYFLLLKSCYWLPKPTPIDESMLAL